jgi:hypothetical protein
MPVPGEVSWLRIALLYLVGSASAALALIGGALAWEAISWEPQHIAELPPMLLQFCVGGAVAVAAGLLATCCLVPAFVYHAEKRETRLPRVRVVRR